MARELRFTTSIGISEGARVRLFMVGDGYMSFHRALFPLRALIRAVAQYFISISTCEIYIS